MKISEDARTEVINNIKGKLKQSRAEQTKIIQAMENATSVEELMSLKQDLLLTQIRNLPIGGLYCYFCVSYAFKDNKCPECPYGKIHKGCDYLDSDYRKITDAKSLFLDSLRNYYFNDDQYEWDQ